MSDALLPPDEALVRRVRPGRWRGFGVCSLISLLLHLLPLVLWPQRDGLPGEGKGRVRASLPATIVSDQIVPPQIAPGAIAGLTDLPEAPASVQAPAPAPEPGLAREYAVVSRVPGGGRLQDYIPIEMLSSKPRFLVDMREYIPASLDDSESGRIVLQVLIGADGEEDGVVVESSELSTRGARRFVQRLNALKLAPGQLDGRPVAARWRMEFSFAALE